MNQAPSFCGSYRGCRHAAFMTRRSRRPARSAPTTGTRRSGAPTSADSRRRPGCGHRARNLPGCRIPWRRAPAEAASLCACARAPVRGGSRITAEMVELGAGQRRALEVARLGRDPIAEARGARRAGQRCQHVRLRLDRTAPGGLRRPAAGRRCRSRRTDRPAPQRRRSPPDGGTQLALGGRARLQESAGRQLDRDPAEPAHDRPPLHDQLGHNVRRAPAMPPGRDPASRPVRQSPRDRPGPARRAPGAGDRARSRTPLPAVRHPARRAAAGRAPRATAAAAP